MPRILDILPPQPSWAVIDASKLTAYKSCPRKYFYSYVLGWRSEYPSNHLVFGSAWHVAVEHLLQHKYSEDALDEARYLFLAYYREHFSEESDEIYRPKDPGNALLSLRAYQKRFAKDVRDYTVLYTEVGGLVSLANGVNMTFKQDAIVEDNETGTIIGIDHKTSQRKTYDWGEKWAVSTQMLLYLHALHCLYGANNDVEMLTRCTFFYKSKPTDFDEHPIKKSTNELNQWLYRDSLWHAMLKRDEEILFNNDNIDDSIMFSFPQNENACFAYNTKCAHFNYCHSWNNPLQHCESTPIGTKIEFWNPLEQPEIKHRVDIANPEPGVTSPCQLKL
jgi:hypothetical protein